MRTRMTSMLLGVVFLMAAAALADTKPVVVFIATGGTIAMKIDPVKHAPVAAISGENLLATVPEVSKYATVEVKNAVRLSPQKARILLMLLLQNGVSGQKDLQAAFDR